MMARPGVDPTTITTSSSTNEGVGTSNGPAISQQQTFSSSSNAANGNNASSSSSCRIFLEDVNPTMDHPILKSKIKALFEQPKDTYDGSSFSVKEVFLSDRNPKKHYGFVTFETPQQAQAALDMLSSSSPAPKSTTILFKQALIAKDLKPRNQQRQQTIQQFALTVKEYDELHGTLFDSSIVLQVHKSHHVRYQQYILEYFSNRNENKSYKRTHRYEENEGEGMVASGRSSTRSSSNSDLNVSVDHHHVGKATTFLFVAISSSSSSASSSDASNTIVSAAIDELTSLLDTKWFFQRDLGRIIRRPSISSRNRTATAAPTSAEGTETGRGGGIVQTSSPQEIAKHMLSEIKEGLSKSLSTDDSGMALRSASGILNVRINIFPPKLRHELLDCIHDRYDEAIAATKSIAAVEESAPPEASTAPKERRNIPLSRIKLSPTNAQYDLSVIRFHEGCDGPPDTDTPDNDTAPSSSSSSYSRPALYLIGQLESTETTRKETNSTTSTLYKGSDRECSTSPPPKRPKFTLGSGVHVNQLPNCNSQAISRAYWKLQEAWERYPYETPPIHLHENGNSISSVRRPPMVALDCGASPGGWVKFLLDRYSSNLKRIYAIDPGALDETVLQDSVVDHVKATIQKSWTYLEEDVCRCTSDHKHRAIDIWVSDMCVKDMPVQVDIVLEALERGLVGSKNIHHLKSTCEKTQRSETQQEGGPQRPSSTTFFVLTLKCIVGHSMETFDRLAEQQAERLRYAGAQNLCVMHLFSNRRSERTIIGYF